MGGVRCPSGIYVHSGDPNSRLHTYTRSFNRRAPSPAPEWHLHQLQKAKRLEKLSWQSQGTGRKSNSWCQIPKRRRQRSEPGVCTAFSSGVVSGLWASEGTWLATVSRMWSWVFNLGSQQRFWEPWVLRLEQEVRSGKGERHAQWGSPAEHLSLEQGRDLTKTDLQLQNTPAQGWLGDLLPKKSEHEDALRSCQLGFAILRIHL